MVAVVGSGFEAIGQSVMTVCGFNCLATDTYVVW